MAIVKIMKAKLKKHFYFLTLFVFVITYFLLRIYIFLHMYLYQKRSKLINLILKLILSRNDSLNNLILLSHQTLIFKFIILFFDRL